MVIIILDCMETFILSTAPHHILTHDRKQELTSNPKEFLIRPACCRNVCNEDTSVSYFSFHSVLFSLASSMLPPDITLTVLCHQQHTIYHIMSLTAHRTDFHSPGHVRILIPHLKIEKHFILQWMINMFCPWSKNCVYGQKTSKKLIMYTICFENTI